jgi:hypothetical protein
MKFIRTIWAVSDGRGLKDIMLNGDGTRFEKGNQIRGRGLCFQPGAQNPSLDSGARLLYY